MWWYLFDVILFQSCFLGLYLLFKKETFYNHNRLYLVATALLSFVIPLLDFGILAFSFGTEESTSQVARQFQSYFIMGEEVNLTPSAGDVEPQTFSWSLGTWLKLIYLLGIGVFAIKFSIGYWKLKQLTQNARFDCMIDQVKCYRLSNSENAFTFWRSVFIGDQISEEQRKKIMTHELEHAKAFHGLDLMMVELFRLIFWISPAHHWLKKELMLVHELQADQVAAKNLNKRDYAQSLLNQAFGTENLNFSHSFFNHSQLKQRLMMLQKKNSRPHHLFKYLLILPLLGLMLTYTACKEDTQEDILELSEKAEIEKYKAEFREEFDQAVAQYGMFSKDMPDKFRITNYNDIDSEKEFYRQNVIMTYLAEQLVEKSKNDPQLMSKNQELLEKIRNSTYEDYLKRIENKITTITETKVTYDDSGDVPFAVIEQVPLFPGCEGLASNKEGKECMSKKISQFVNENFDVNLAKDLGLKGTNRVYVQFKIDKNGDVVNVQARAPHPDLKEEGERVISQLPQMQPGKQDGEQVGVLYSLPITFHINE
ncbi:M56 family metallopeptidase [Psychroflexus tropicus]|uniref:M56 family metallopeptidase n=1 Tax=Psychroflexus tropicus TaxID=197345 RepID=UPI00039BBAFC|nr:M56 family metallopeptidase [Psychroflexus tropicus]